MEFWRAEGQPKELEGDVFIEEAMWATMTELVKEIIDDMIFEKPTSEMTKDRRPLYIKAHFNGKPFNKVFEDLNKFLWQL